MKNLTEKDKRALFLYFVIALLSAVCLAVGMLFTSDFRVGPKAAPSQPATKVSPTIPRDR